VLNKLTLALLPVIALGTYATPAMSNEKPSKRPVPVYSQVQSTVTVLPGVRLIWSSPTPGEFLDPAILARADVSRSKVVSAKTNQVTLYVDFS